MEMGRNAVFYFLDDTTPAVDMNAFQAFSSAQTCDGSSSRRVSLERYYYFHGGGGDGSLYSLHDMLSRCTHSLAVCFFRICTGVVFPFNTQCCYGLCLFASLFRLWGARDEKREG